MPHVFISYHRNSAKEMVADELIPELTEEKINFWWDAKIPTQEDDWRDQIDEQLRGAYAMILIVTPEAMESKYVTFEWSFALGLGIPIFPVVYKPTDEQKIHPRLRTHQLLDFTSVHKWTRLTDELKNLRPAYDNYRQGILDTLRELIQQPHFDREFLNVFLQNRLIKPEDLEYIEKPIEIS